MEPDTMSVESSRLSERLNSVGSVATSTEESEFDEFSAMRRKIDVQEAVNQAEKQVIAGKSGEPSN
jgi:phage shock protein A